MLNEPLNIRIAILDLYEGPFEAVKDRGELFYGTAALRRTYSALAPGGLFAVWSEDPDRAFEKRLSGAGFDFRRHRPRKGSRHVIYVAEKR